MLAATAVALLTAAAPEALTGLEIARRSVEARGGLARLRAVRSVRSAGRLSVGRTAAIPLRTTWARPSRVRMETGVGAQKGVQVIDGDRGWLLAPWLGIDAPRALAARTARALARAMDFDGPLIAALRGQAVLRLAGRALEHGREVWQLDVVRADGSAVRVAIDAATLLEASESSTDELGGGRLETRFEDYRRVDGLALPHRLTTTVDGARVDAVELDRIEIDVPVEPGLFDARVPR